MKDFFAFLFSKAFLKQLLFIILFLALVLALVLFWLRTYTNHGQKLALPSYIGMRVDDAQNKAKDATFQILVKDSIHVVGKPGGEILSQNPLPEARVKENRKIYVTTSKYRPDTYNLSELPRLYGSEYDQRSRDLKRFEINTKIKSRQYDPGEPNHILEVWYDGKMIIGQDKLDNNVKIEKGASLEFVVSDRAGGRIIIPDLTCQEFSAAEFLLKAGNKLSIGRIIANGDITNRNTAYVIDQFPKSDGMTEIDMGSTIDITISQERPSGCY